MSFCAGRFTEVDNYRSGFISFLYGHPPFGIKCEVCFARSMPPR